MIFDLRNEYPHLDAAYAEAAVPGRIAAVFQQYRRAEQALEKRRSRNGDTVSLDAEPGIESYIIHQSPSPEEELERRIRSRELYAALRALPRKQADRIYAHYILGMSIAEIARADHVSRPAVLKSIALGCMELRKILCRRSREGYAYGNR